MKLTDIRAFKGPIESLSHSSALTIIARKVRCELRRLNSPYSSHTECAYSYSNVEGLATLFDNGNYKLVVYDSLQPLERDAAVELLANFTGPDDDHELIVVHVPALFVQGLFKRIEEFMPGKPSAALVSLALYRRRLVGYDEDGKTHFAGESVNENEEIAA